MLFFYNKLGFISKRYVELTKELQRRGYSPNPIPLEKLEEGILRRMFFDYTPTQDALEINRHVSRKGSHEHCEFWRRSANDD